MRSFGSKYFKCDPKDNCGSENSMHKFVQDFTKEIPNNSPTMDFVHAQDTKPMQLTSKHCNFTLNNASRNHLNASLKDYPITPGKANAGSSLKTPLHFAFLPGLDADQLPEKCWSTKHSFARDAVVSPSCQLDFKKQKLTPRNNNEIKSNSNGNLTAITGNVEFVMRIHKQFSRSNLLYEVYGKILRISPGKFSCERVILLRNDVGPILQAVLYEIDTPLQKISVGRTIENI